MLTRLLLLSALACGQALAKDAQPTTAATAASRPDCATESTIPRDANAIKPCKGQGTSVAMLAPEKLLAAEPTGAGPRTLTRNQVVAEISRARSAGELDWAAMEVGIDSPRPAPRR